MSQCALIGTVGRSLDPAMHGHFVNAVRLCERLCGRAASEIPVDDVCLEPACAATWDVQTPLLAGIAHVVELRPEEQMVIADTNAVVAAMKDVLIGWDGAVSDRPSEPMRVDVELLPPFRDGKLAVELATAPAYPARGPFPTAVRRLPDLRPESGNIKAVDGRMGRVTRNTTRPVSLCPRYDYQLIHVFTLLQS